MSIFDEPEVVKSNRTNTIEKYGAYGLWALLMMIVTHFILTQKDSTQRNFYSYVIVVSGWTYINSSINQSILDKEQ